LERSTRKLRGWREEESIKNGEGIYEESRNRVSFRWGKAVIAMNRRKGHSMEGKGDI
jgi:hypothetical protein